MILYYKPPNIFSSSCTFLNFDECTVYSCILCNLHCIVKAKLHSRTFSQNPELKVNLYVSYKVYSTQTCFIFDYKDCTDPRRATWKDWGWVLSSQQTRWASFTLLLSLLLRQPVMVGILSRKLANLKRRKARDLYRTHVHMGSDHWVANHYSQFI